MAIRYMPLCTSAARIRPATGSGTPLAKTLRTASDEALAAGSKARFDFARGL